MKALLVSRSILLGALVVVGCGKSTGTESPPPVQDDGGVVRTVKLDAPPDRGARDSKATSRDGVVNGSDSLIVPPSITVTIDPASLVPPGDGGVPATLIVPANYGPKPLVTVAVVSNSGDMRVDDVSSVTAALNDQVTGAAVASVKLARSETESAPESNTTFVIFSGVPIDLSKVATGSYDLVCTATTVGGTSANATVTLWVDTGPAVVVNSPVEGGFYKGSASVEVDATQPRFAITSVTMRVGQGSEVPLTRTSNGVYSGTIDFKSFVPPLVGDVLVTFRAYDENGTQTVVTRHCISDNTGPSITATVPASGAMVGSVITIKATVDDPARVDTSSVVAVVGNGDVNFEVRLALPAAGGNVYSNFFDTTKLPTYALFPSISFRAQDVLGNESAVSYELSLDNTPPTIDLDPPMIRRVNKDGICSWLFDPVGPDAVDDGDVVTQLFDVRVRAQDNGNTALTGEPDWVPIGGVDQGQVQLFILNNTSRPLVVDTSEPPDGFCDEINPDLVPTTKPETDVDAQVVNMVVMAPVANADFSPQPGVACSKAATASPPDPGAFCGTTANASKAQFVAGAPTPHCYTMTEVLNYAGGGLPSIYTIGPIVNDSLQCAGHQFDASNNLKDGWTCLAAVARDVLGNKQVSRPIRACVMATPSSKECPEFRPLTAIVTSDPVEIQTSVPLVGPGGVALKANDEVIVSGVVGVSGVNGRWKVDPLDTSGVRFSLQGAHGVVGAVSVLVMGRVVPVAAMPDCTGTVIKRGTDGGLPVVDYTKPCKPWSTFPPGELHPYGT
ncbi:MAG TPA: hypothetical protein VJ860_21585 [Polyangia bacterium]|nr:hypothetical protein [Polyangia bacterium]